MCIRDRTYIDATSAPLKNTGVIRLYDAEAFDGMRKACQLTARCLDDLAGIVAPGVTTDTIDRFVFEYGMDHGAIPVSYTHLDVYKRQKPRRGRIFQRATEDRK